ncbi:MAG: GNAT family N-acetyltransferase [candidate division Zixibacteria bacterium]|nr:GNAT family N-acetyltransferase [candidate division Zixibacteria bacterium]
MNGVLADRQQLAEKLKDFPSYYSNVLSSAHTSVVVCVTNQKQIVAACGIQRPFNYLVVYVQEEYRGQGLGTLAVRQAVNIARKSNFSFVNLAVSTENPSALRLYSKTGFRVTALFSKFRFKIMTLPLRFKGKIVYAFFSKVCSLLPEVILMNLVLSLMSVAKSIRQVGAVGFQEFLGAS